MAAAHNTPVAPANRGGQVYCTGRTEAKKTVTCKGSCCDDFIDARNPDGTLKLRNPHLEHMEQDTLYHLSLGTLTHDLEEMFGDVKFVCMGGTPQRMKTFAHYVRDEIGLKLPTGTALTDISQYRYSMYKVGPVISVSHGMGVSSIGILLHEVMKLMYYAKVKDPVFFRIGTSGGIGIEPGTLVVSNKAVDGMLHNFHEEKVLGEIITRPAVLDHTLAQELVDLADPADGYGTICGGTMCATDFYEGQARLDGPFCYYTEKDKMEYIKRLYDNGIRNIEMEATVFSAFTHHAGIRAAIVCVTFIDRLKGDQVVLSEDTMHQWQLRPQQLVARYIKHQLQKSGDCVKQTTPPHNHIQYRKKTQQECENTE